MIHVFPRWSFDYLQKDKPKHTAAGHEVIYGTLPAIAIPPFHPLFHYFNHRILNFH